MELSREQDKALKAVDRWLKESDKQIFRLFGYAGTGKTTLAKHFAEGVSNVMFGAFTGKAAYILNKKGCYGATTIHSMIYIPKDRSKKRLNDLTAKLIELRMELGKRIDLLEVDRHPEIVQLLRAIEEEKVSKGPSFVLNLDSEVRAANLVIIDECSMVNEQMAKDLMSFGTKILVLGDPAQLPPIFGPGFFTDAPADIMLTEIHRQARENPIIALATDVRQGKALRVGSYGDSEVITKTCEEHALAADQILVGRNATRKSSNRRLRELLGRDSPLPVVGDKLVCLRNNHDIGLLNGGLWEVTKSQAVHETCERMTLGISDEDKSMDVLAHTHYFRGDDDDLPYWEKKEAEEFDYGYALTVHKSQGSQWSNVLLFDESQCFRKDRWKWLYTGLTRAADKIKVVLK